jgi:26S proteasome regulatory subunit N12
LGVLSIQELLVAREVYEIGAQYSVSVKDVPSFERYMSILKSMYTDQPNSLPESSRKYELLGLNLLCLLSQNRLGDFHTELELLPPDVLLSNPYIENPVQLEQFIMEGKYNKVIDIKYNVPADSYKFFIDVLLDTIRGEIGEKLSK